MSQPGTPRTEPRPNRQLADRTDAILRATLSLALENGYRGLSIEGIAARAGVGKHTVYRRWPNKTLLILDALLGRSMPKIRHPDTGNLHADLRKQMLAGIEALMAKPYGPLLAAVVADAQYDPAVTAKLSESFIAPQVQSAVDRVRSAQNAGEVSADIDADTAVRLLYGPVWYAFLLHHRPMTPDELDQTLNAAFHGLLPRC